MAALSFDEIDDILYFTRTNSLSDLEATLAELSTRHSLPASQILAACIDPETGNTPLHYASANGLDLLIEQLLRILQQSSSSQQQQQQPTPSDPASPANSAAPLINAQNKEGNTPLHWSAYNGHLTVVKILLSAGADMWVKNSAGHLALFEAERAEKTEVVVFLLEKGGAEVEKAGVEGGVGRAEEEELGSEVNGGGEEGGNGEGSSAAASG